MDVKPQEIVGITLLLLFSLHVPQQFFFHPPLLQKNIYYKCFCVRSCLLREDVVRVHDGVGPLSPVITFLCNQEAHAEILSTNESLFIEFTSTSVWPGHGFKAVYYFVHNSGKFMLKLRIR